MRRTYLLLFFLILLIGCLTFFRLQSPSSSLETKPTPTLSLVPIPTPTVIPSIIPNPTRLTHSSINQIFSLSYPQNWELATFSGRLIPPEFDRFTLKPKKSTSASQFVFSLSQLDLEKNLTCLTSESDCQILTINQINYRLNGTKINDRSAALTYEAYLKPYYLKIEGKVSGDLSNLETLVSDWEKITQSFNWQINSISSSSAQTPLP